VLSEAETVKVMYCLIYHFVQQTETCLSVTAATSMSLNRIYNFAVVNAVLPPFMSHTDHFPFSTDSDVSLQMLSADSSPLTSTWPHLRCDVGLENGE